MHNTDISKKIMDTIATDKVTPKPRWHFWLQESGVWALGAAATFCGAIAVSATLFVFFTAPIRFHDATHDNLIQFWADFLPLIWIAMFVMFIFLADYVVRKTKRGYRYNIVVMTVASALLSILIGYVGFLIGLGEFLENRVGPSIPFHTPIKAATQRAFYQPDKGLLIGQIQEGDTLHLEAKDGTVWKLDFTNIPEAQRVFINASGTISLVGTSTGNQLFVVCMVLPLEGDVPPEALERNSDQQRTKICKGVRPYERLQTKLMMRYENQ